MVKGVEQKCIKKIFNNYFTSIAGEKLTEVFQFNLTANPVNKFIGRGKSINIKANISMNNIY